MDKEEVIRKLIERESFIQSEYLNPEMKYYNVLWTVMQNIYSISNISRDWFLDYDKKRMEKTKA